LQKNYGDVAEYQYVQIFAQWGDTPRALEALERSVVLRDGGLAFTKVDAMLDSLRNEPRFKAVLQDSATKRDRNHAVEATGNELASGLEK
jgi:hypothetical protein